MSKGQRVAKVVAEYIQACLERQSIAHHMGDQTMVDGAHLRVLHASRRMEAEMDACFGEKVSNVV